MFGLAFGFFKIQNTVMKGGIRSDEEDEIEGLDMPEMGVYAYPEFHMVEAVLHLGNGDGADAEPVKEPETIG